MKTHETINLLLIRNMCTVPFFGSFILEWRIGAAVAATNAVVNNTLWLFSMLNIDNENFTEIIEICVFVPPNYVYPTIFQSERFFFLLLAYLSIVSKFLFIVLVKFNSVITPFRERKESHLSNFPFLNAESKINAKNLFFCVWLSTPLLLLFGWFSVLFCTVNHIVYIIWLHKCKHIFIHASIMISFCLSFTPHIFFRLFAA